VQPPSRIHAAAVAGARRGDDLDRPSTGSRSPASPGHRACHRGHGRSRLRSSLHRCPPKHRVTGPGVERHNGRLRSGPLPDGPFASLPVEVPGPAVEVRPIPHARPSCHHKPWRDPEKQGSSHSPGPVRPADSAPSPLRALASAASVTEDCGNRTAVRRQMDRARRGTAGPSPLIELRWLRRPRDDHRARGAGSHCRATRTPSRPCFRTTRLG
jgi:hypothetical protein